MRPLSIAPRSPGPSASPSSASRSLPPSASPVAAAAPSAAASPAGTTEHSISVHGTGRITIKPDTATFSVGIDAQANKAKAAMDQASARMTAIIAALKAGGVADADRQTSQISLSPTYDYNNGNRPVLTGYTASQTLTVKVRAINNTGDLIDAAVGAGANNVGGISFSVDDPAAAMDQARTAAVADARHRAEALAQAAGITLGAPISIVENGGTPPPPISSTRRRRPGRRGQEHAGRPGHHRNVHRRGHRVCAIA